MGIGIGIVYSVYNDDKDRFAEQGSQAAQAHESEKHFSSP